MEAACFRNTTYCVVYLDDSRKQFDVHVTVHRLCILPSATNKMQRYTTFFVIVNALHVSDGFSAHHQELKNCTHSIWYMSSFLAAVAASKLDIYQMLCVQFLSS